MFVPITIHITFHGTVASITFLSLCIGHVILNNYYAFIAKFNNKFQFSFNGHIHTHTTLFKKLTIVKSVQPPKIRSNYLFYQKKLTYV